MHTHHERQHGRSCHQGCLDQKPEVSHRHPCRARCRCASGDPLDLSRYNKDSSAVAAQDFKRKEKGVTFCRPWTRAGLKSVIRSSSSIPGIVCLHALPETSALLLPDAADCRSDPLRLLSVHHIIIILLPPRHIGRLREELSSPASAADVWKDLRCCSSGVSQRSACACCHCLKWS